LFVEREREVEKRLALSSISRLSSFRFVLLVEHKGVGGFYFEKETK